MSQSSVKCEQNEALAILARVASQLYKTFLLLFPKQYSYMCFYDGAARIFLPPNAAP